MIIQSLALVVVPLKCEIRKVKLEKSGVPSKIEMLANTNKD